MKGFIEFIRKQGVVGLAIGFVVGVASGALVNALVNDFITPLIGLILQTKNLETLTFTINEATFAYGHFISVFISFITILAVIYFLFKALRLEKLDLEEEEEKK